MTDDMTARANLETGMRFDVETGSGHHITLDAAAYSGGENAGPRPMEMLLVALAGCSAMSVLSILRKKRQDIRGYEIRVRGKRADEQPKEFTAITVEHIFSGQHIQPEAVARAIELTEERYCGVSAMLEEAAEISSTFQIVQVE